MRTQFSNQTMCSRQNGPHHHRGKIHRIFPTQMSRFLNNTFITHHPRWSSAYVLQNGRAALFMGQCNLRDQEHQVIKHFYSSEEKCLRGSHSIPLPFKVRSGKKMSTYSYFMPRNNCKDHHYHSKEKKISPPILVWIKTILAISYD